MGSRITLNPPDDYLFHRDVCSYGYFLLAPNVWRPAERVLVRPLALDGGVATFRIAQPGAAPGAPVRAVADRALTRPQRAQATRMLARMLSLNDEGVRDFHRVDPRWKKIGRGRLFRSPTFFEDLIKTVTSCNVTWPSTVSMNRRLCAVINPAFPTAAQLRRRRPATLRARCGVGYRDQRIVDLARIIDSGDLDPARLEDPATPDDEVHATLLELPGVGPYAAANIMQLLGRFAHLPIDTETYRHARSVLGMQGDDKALAAQVRDHYEPFGAHRFRSYWFELWDFYERKRGPSWDWEPSEVASTFTAAKI